MLHYRTASMLQFLCSFDYICIKPHMFMLMHKSIFVFLFFFFLLFIVELGVSWLKYIQLELNLHGVFLDCSEQQLKE